ncbi:MAG: hypothetical protein J5J00_06270 [Deltaproteobacteria bacterium]|nr:hypothetical protein [Deltaproteobacteria bacterium]
MDSLRQKIESFHILITVTDQSLANKLCGALEMANIAVMLEHVEIVEDSKSRVGYRLLAPAHMRETAMRLVDVQINLHQTRSAVTTRPDFVVE